MLGGQIAASLSPVARIIGELHAILGTAWRRDRLGQRRSQAQMLKDRGDQILERLRLMLSSLDVG